MNIKCSHKLEFTGEVLANHYVYKCQNCGESVWVKNPPGADGAPDYSRACCAHPSDKLELLRVEVKRGPCGKELPRTVFRCGDCGREGTAKDLM